MTGVVLDKVWLRAQKKIGWWWLLLSLLLFFYSILVVVVMRMVVMTTDDGDGDGDDGDEGGRCCSLCLSQIQMCLVALLISTKGSHDYLSYLHCKYRAYLWRETFGNGMERRRVVQTTILAMKCSDFVFTVDASGSGIAAAVLSTASFETGLEKSQESTSHPFCFGAHSHCIQATPLETL